MTYVAFLRGINVGGKMVAMEKLRQALLDLGFQNVRTLLNSGNVVFETPEKNTSKLVQQIEEKLEKTFGFHIGTIVRSMEQIQSIIDSNPFKNIPATPQTRFYVTFLAEKSQSKLKIPYETLEKDFRILKVTYTEVCSVLTLSETKGTVDLMKILEKEFGKNVTTRNWNTVMKIAILK